MSGQKIAVVTGAGSGIGRALALALADAGFVIHAIDKNAAGLGQTVTLAAGRGRIESETLDVTDTDALRAAITRAAANGKLYWLANCAGIGAWGDVRSFDADVWSRVVDVNFLATVNASLCAYEIMAEQGFGQIVNVASLAGLIPAPVVVPYAAAKHGVVGFSTSLRAEAREYGVRVSVACPGVVATGFHDALITGSDTVGRPRVPRGAIGPDEAASEILRGVQRNRGVVVFPRGARWLWRWSRWLPRVMKRTNRKTMARFLARQSKRE